MLHRMKPLPRALIIIVLVGGVGFALSRIDFSTKIAKKTEAPVTGAVEAPPVTVVTPGQAPVIITSPPSVAPAPEAPAAPPPVAAPEAPIGLQPAQSNSGLDAVLNAGRK